MAKLRASVRMLVARAARLMAPILPSRLRIILLARLTAYKEALELQRKTDFWLRAASYTPVLAVDARGHRLLIDPTDQAIGRELFFHTLLNERGYSWRQVTVCPEVEAAKGLGAAPLRVYVDDPCGCRRTAVRERSF